MDLLTWNVRGLDNPNKVPQIRKIISQKNLDWIGLTETMLINIDPFFAK